MATNIVSPVTPTNLPGGAREREPAVGKIKPLQINGL